MVPINLVMVVEAVEAVGIGVEVEAPRGVLAQLAAEEATISIQRK